jgi:hypothetical protein
LIPSTRAIVWILGVAVALLNGSLFLTGYRLTADDVMFLEIGMTGWDAIAAVTDMHAVHQARIGQYMMMPLNIFAAYHVGSLWFRILFVALFFSQYLLFAKWFEPISASRVAPALFLVLSALTALDYYHLPPTSYPLQNTVPFLLILGCRLMVVGSDHRFKRLGPRDYLASVALIVAMTVSEYAFLFATGLLAIEYGGRLLRAGSWSAARAVITDRRFVLDLATCVLAFAIYLVWRLTHQSAYDGNNLDGALSGGAALTTWSLHAFGLNILAITQIDYALASTTALGAIAALAVALAAGIGIWLSRRDLEALKDKKLWTLLGIFFALYVTLPLSLTAKQREWCTLARECLFLDSRSAYFGATLALVVVIGGLTAFLPRTKSARRVAVATVLFALVAVLPTVTMLRNQMLERSMQAQQSAWERATDLRCTTFDSSAPTAAHLIDPDNRVFFHAHLSRDAFWERYVQHFC